MTSAHSDQNQEIDEVSDRAVACPRCGHENTATQRFCSQCGARLWEPCCHCGNLVPAAERFCGHCGINLAGALRQNQERLEASLDRARELEAAGRIDEALALLEGFPRVEHSQLSHLVAHADRLIERLRKDQHRKTAEVTERLEEAKALLAHNGYEEAVQVLESIPAALRNEEAERLLRETTEKAARIRELERALNGQANWNDVGTILAQSCELLSLKPGHHGAERLIQQLRKKLFAKAQTRLLEHRYEDAFALLERIPEFVRDAQIDKARRHAAEAAWLWRDLLGSPVVDETLPEIAHRMHKLAPSHPQLPQLLSELQRRRRITDSDPRRAFPRWARQVTSKVTGCAMEWLHGFSRIAVADALAEDVLVKNAGRLWSACGAALQGLGLASIAVDLTPKPAQSGLGRVAGLLTKDVFRFGPPRRLQSCWGIEIGNYSLKAVRLTRHEEKATVEIDRFAVMDYSKPLSRAAEEEKELLIGPAVESFRSRWQSAGGPICLVLPPQHTFAQKFHVPSMPREKAAKVIGYEISRRIPFPVGSIVWDFHLPGANEPHQPGGKNEVLTVGGKRHPIERLLQLFRQAKLTIEAVQSPAVALHNAVWFDRLGTDANAEPDEANGQASDPYAVLDVGGATTILLWVSSPQMLSVRSIGFGTEQLVRTLIQRFNLTAAAAEVLLLQPARAEWLHELYQAMQPAFQSLCEDLRRGLETFSHLSGGRKIGKLFCCGGAFHIHGFLRQLVDASS